MERTIKRFASSLAGIYGGFILFQAVIFWPIAQSTETYSRQFVFGFRMGSENSMYIALCFAVWLATVLGAVIFVGPMNRARARTCFYWSVLTVTAISMILLVIDHYEDIAGFRWVLLLFCASIVKSSAAIFLEVERSEEVTE